MSGKYNHLLHGLQFDLQRAERAFMQISSRLNRNSGSATNPAGDIGGIRSRSAKRKNQIMDAYIDAAGKYAPAKARVESLQKQIADIESGEREAREARQEAARPAREAAVAEFKAKRVAWFDGLKAGDSVDIGGNQPVVIIKKNRNSIKTGPQKDAVWTLREITGIDHAEADAIRARA